LRLLIELDCANALKPNGFVLSYVVKLDKIVALKIEGRLSTVFAFGLMGDGLFTAVVDPMDIIFYKTLTYLVE